MIKVSVLLITYNHEEFIKEAIESALMQKTNFRYELVIGEDCSSDGTRDIIEHYKGKYPDIIKLCLQEKNSGASENIKEALRICEGEYIAFLEGDDYWTDENKLQKQADFLDKNPDCSLCGHGYKRYYEETKEFFGDIVYENEKFSLEDLLREDILNVQNKFHIRSLTRMFRKTALINAPKDLKYINLWDYVIEVLLLRNGNGAYLEDVMGVYRINKNSKMQRDLAKTAEMLIDMRKEILELIDNEYKHYVLESIENKKRRSVYYKFIEKFKNDSCNDKVIEYFRKNKYKKIIVYGAGVLGKLLGEKLKYSDLEIICFVEGRNKSDKEMNILALNELNNAIKADVIVVTPFFDFENIKNQLLSIDVNKRIISLEEVL